MKITLRETLLVVLVIALALGWFLDSSALHRRAETYENLSQALERELRKTSPATHIEIKVDPSGRETNYKYNWQKK